MSFLTSLQSRLPLGPARAMPCYWCIPTSSGHVGWAHACWSMLAECVKLWLSAASQNIGANCETLGAQIRGAKSLDVPAARAPHIRVWWLIPYRAASVTLLHLLCQLLRTRASKQLSELRVPHAAWKWGECKSACVLSLQHGFWWSYHAIQRCLCSRAPCKLLSEGGGLVLAMCHSSPVCKAGCP